MAQNIPSSVAYVVADPKSVSTSALQSAMGYIDDIDPNDFELMAEEHARRGGDNDYQGYMEPSYT